ncbi:unnamed protein product [Clonostachys rosea]|uniref:Uncharacterized protein n=1 Tax=Bionectria ochroleuca TaxID=29856 RepID=A0ABY6U814_BIOOC|nr:unnamed protein product [Clonostachys rosea]
MFTHPLAHWDHYIRMEDEDEADTDLIESSAMKTPSLVTPNLVLILSGFCKIQINKSFVFLHFSTLGNPPPSPLPLSSVGLALSCVLLHHSLVPPHILFSLSPVVSPNAGPLLALSLSLHVYLDDGVVLALLVQALVSPLALPFARLLIKGQVLALLAGLGLDSLLRGEALPFGGGLGLGDGLLSRQVCTGWREREEDAFLGGAERAG